MLFKQKRVVRYEMDDGGRVHVPVGSTAVARPRILPT
jgi:hypothetical protein